jgi:hypothetical protein
MLGAHIPYTLMVLVVHAGDGMYTASDGIASTGGAVCTGEHILYPMIAGMMSC